MGLRHGSRHGLRPWAVWLTLQNRNSDAWKFAGTTEGNAWAGAAFTLDSSIGLQKTKAAQCKTSYATTEAENARIIPAAKKNAVATQHNLKEKLEESEQSVTAATRDYCMQNTQVLLWEVGPQLNPPFRKSQSNPKSP